MNPNEEFYDKIFGEGNQCYNVLIENKVRNISKFVTGSEKKVLDIGCGDGRMRRLFDEKTEYHGIDISTKALRLASGKGISIKKIDLNKERLPYKNDSFDTVVCADVIEHLVFPEKTLSEIYRVLKKNGSLILSVPNINSWHNRILVPLGFFPIHVESTGLMPVGEVLFHMTCGHLKAFNKKSISLMLEKTGFKKMRYAGSSQKINREIIMRLSQAGKERTFYNNFSGFLISVFNTFDDFMSMFLPLANTIIVKAVK